MSLIEIKVPDIGDFDEVAVIELLVKPGDAIQAEQSLITVESDKASMEIPSSHAGVVKELKVKLGDKVKQGSVVLVLEAAAGQVAEKNPAPALANAAQAAINSAVGVLVLLVGLWFFGRDGKMATYAALVTLVALSQWATGRQWR